MSKYATIDEWLDEIESYGTRRERVPEGALPWLEYAWKFGAAAEGEACAKIAEQHIPPTEAAKTVDWSLCIRDANLSKRIAAAIRAREDKA